jgi:hypothetical protein
MDQVKRLCPWVPLEQFRLKSDRKAILKMKKLLAFLTWSRSATVDDALDGLPVPAQG